MEGKLRIKSEKLVKFSHHSINALLALVLGLAEDNLISKTFFSENKEWLFASNIQPS